MIFAEGYSCHRAARVLKIAYNNAKVILTVFRREGRVKQIPIRLKRFVADFKSDPNNVKGTLDTETYKEMRKIFFPKLNFSADGLTRANREKSARVAKPKRTAKVVSQMAIAKPRMTLTLHAKLPDRGPNHGKAQTTACNTKNSDSNGLSQKE
jgi:hypothetical protein